MVLPCLVEEAEGFGGVAGEGGFDQEHGEFVGGFDGFYEFSAATDIGGGGIEEKRHVTAQEGGYFMEALSRKGVSGE